LIPCLTSVARNLYSIKHYMKPSGMIRIRCCPGKTGAGAKQGEVVILLHGLCRTYRSMQKMAKALVSAGYTVVNVGYPSRTASIQELAAAVMKEILFLPEVMDAQAIHFVTHSLGGMLVRQYLKTQTIQKLGRVVMLGPPNQGSQVVDALGWLKIFQWMHGPAGNQLGTHIHAFPRNLGPVYFPLGIIAGDRSINWINSCMIDGTDDGKVSVEQTKVDGMTGHIVIHTAHPYLMRNNKVIAQTIQFLRKGHFQYAE